MKKATTVYFSATYTTRKIVEYMAQKLADDMAAYKLRREPDLFFARYN